MVDYSDKAPQDWIREDAEAIMEHYFDDGFNLSEPMEDKKMIPIKDLGKIISNEYSEEAAKSVLEIIPVIEIINSERSKKEAARADVDSIYEDGENPNEFKTSLEFLESILGDLGGIKPDKKTE